MRGQPKPSRDDLSGTIRMTEGTARDTSTAEIEPPVHISEELVHRAREGAHLMTVRTLLMRVVGVISNLLLIALVTPSEFGLFAVARSIIIIVEAITELGFVGTLVRKRAEATREEYAAVTGLQLLIALGIFTVAVVWPYPFLGFGALDRRWHGWLLVTLAAQLSILPFSVGAKVRLERHLEYNKVAFVDVSFVFLQSIGLLLFAYFGYFTVGIFIVHAAMYLYYHLLVVFWSPGPRPSFRLGRLKSFMRESAGFSSAAWLNIAREYATSILVAKLFGLDIAGYWAFAVRFGQVLNVAFDGFRRAAIPVAARLTDHASALRDVATDGLSGAAKLTLPLALGMFVGIPVVTGIWPKWEPALVLAQLYLLGYGMAGVIGASLAPVAIALRGASAALAEQLVPTAVGWIGLVLLWSLGLDTISLVVLPMYITSVAVLFVMTEPSGRPRRRPELLRFGLSFVTGILIYLFLRSLNAPDLATAVVAWTASVAWLRPRQLISSLLVRFARERPDSVPDTP